MDIYARKAASIPQKLTLTAIELAILVLSGWVLFGGGAHWFSWLFGPLPDAIPVRRYVIFGFSAVILSRMAFTMFHLMKRHLPWGEAFTIPLAFALYYLGFAILVLPSGAPLGIWDLAGIVLFALGCFLNTGSEVMRDRFKKNPANKGKLYTGGLFSLSMHINFFGDILWICGYAIVAHSPWAWIIPLYALAFFVFLNVPMLDRHLAEHYGQQFTDYATRTKRLVPLVW